MFRSKTCDSRHVQFHGLEEMLPDNTGLRFFYANTDPELFVHTKKATTCFGLTWEYIRSRT
uniref:Uncharacterized protein n=1 Tax=Glossina morsitans morsitans TaxID=37546 RepID=A0ABK9NFQ9_GLOMM